MSNIASTDPAHSPSDVHIKRRALVIGGPGADTLLRQLAESGYETIAATSGSFARVITGFVPDVVLIVLEREVDAESEAVAVARRLREEPVTHALPLVLVYIEEERLMRSVALNVGVDDCFGIWTPHDQILARLDALFWRIEAGRRAASMSGDKRFEIDNFMVLLEAVREDIRDSAIGSLALIYAVPSNDAGIVFDRQLRDRMLAEAHGFFKLNLRRIDAIAFYGPTTLLVYLPKLKAVAASSTLMSLRGSFLAERSDIDLAIGITTFPDDGNDVEELVELAEIAAGKVREAVAAKQTSEPVEEVDSETDKIVEIAQSEARQFADGENAQPTIRDQVDTVDVVGSGVPFEHRAATVNEIDVSRASAEQAAARERDRRKRGATIPRRLLLTVSDAGRMAQINALVRSAGYEARTAFDGQQALDLLRIESPDVILLDFELRGIDGLEMLRRLRKQTQGKLTVPVVMLLPPSQVTARREALELGARGIVTIPYDPAELLDSVRLAGNAG